MTRIVVVVDRDDDGRLHGTVEPEDPAASPVGFTGVIEFVATVEAALDRPLPEPGHGSGEPL